MEVEFAPVSGESTGGHHERVDLLVERVTAELLVHGCRNLCSNPPPSLRNPLYGPPMAIAGLDAGSGWLEVSGSQGPVDHLLAEVRQLLVVVLGVLAEQVERIAQSDVEVLGDDSFGLFDGDTAVQGNL